MSRLGFADKIATEVEPGKLPPGFDLIGAAIAGHPGGSYHLGLRQPFQRGQGQLARQQGSRIPQGKTAAAIARLVQSRRGPAATRTLSTALSSALLRRRRRQLSCRP